MPAKGTRPKFSNSYYIKAYELAKSALSNTEIANALGINKGTLKLWLKTDEAFRDAIRKGRQSVRGTEDTGVGFLDYVYGRLPKKIRRLWDRLQLAEKSKNPEKKIEALLAEKGKRTRQWLFVHALVVSNFSLPNALKMSYVSQGTWEGWRKSDPDFVEMVNFLHTMKKEWAEGCLLNLVAGGDTTATIFLNRALNPEKGYNPKVQVHTTGKILHGHVDATQVLEKMSVEARRELLAASTVPEGQQPLQLPPRKVTVTDEE